jgi:hypothetical protein
MKMCYNLCHGILELAKILECRLIGSVSFHPYGLIFFLNSLVGQLENQSLNWDKNFFEILKQFGTERVLNFSTM